MCKQFFVEARFKSHRCSEYSTKWFDGTWKSDVRVGRNITGKAGQVALNYLKDKHELETWKGNRGFEFDKLRIKVKRNRKIIFSLLQGKSMKKAKKEVGFKQ